MTNIEKKLLLPETQKKKGFSDLIKVNEGSPSYATLEALGTEITFGWVIEEGKKKFKPIARSKEGRQSPGSMDIPKELFNALRERAIAVTNSYAKAEGAKAKKQQLNNQIKKQQPDLF